jgi:hypothetical protein
MIRFELSSVIGSKKLHKFLDERYPLVVPKISPTEATHVVEQVLTVLIRAKLEYVIAFNMLDLFVLGEQSTIDLTVCKRKKDSNVFDGLGMISFSLNYGESPQLSHKVLRAWSREQFTKVMNGANKIK